MNVKELIKALQKESKKEKEVYIYDDGDLYNIQMVDFSISDRLDLNINSGKIKLNKTRELSDKSYSVLTILKRSTPLMDGFENATDEEVIKACSEIVEYLKD